MAPAGQGGEEIELDKIRYWLLTHDLFKHLTAIQVRALSKAEGKGLSLRRVEQGLVPMIVRN